MNRVLLSFCVLPDHESSGLLQPDSINRSFPMADIAVKAIGKSEAEVAHEMAMHLLMNVQGSKSLKDITRDVPERTR
jgi:hypothetical protein